MRRRRIRRLRKSQRGLPSAASANATAAVEIAEATDDGLACDGADSSVASFVPRAMVDTKASARAFVSWADLMTRASSSALVPADPPRTISDDRAQPDVDDPVVDDPSLSRSTGFAVEDDDAATGSVPADDSARAPRRTADVTGPADTPPPPPQQHQLQTSTELQQVRALDGCDGGGGDGVSAGREDGAAKRFRLADSPLRALRRPARDLWSARRRAGEEV